MNPRAAAAIHLAPDQPWSVEHFAAFWAQPDPELARGFLTDDVVGYWPWSEQPVRGVEQYLQGLAGVLALVPDLHLEMAEHASNGDVIFIRWIAHGTGAKGPMQMSGIDRIRLRNGKVAENFICFDTARFQALVGKAQA